MFYILFLAERFIDSCDIRCRQVQRMSTQSEQLVLEGTDDVVHGRHSGCYPQPWAALTTQRLPL